MMGAFVQTMGQLAQGLQQGNEQIAQAMGQIGQMVSEATMLVAVSPPFERVNSALLWLAGGYR
jgi:hypothetical protein